MDTHSQSPTFFDVENSVDVVNARMSAATDPRLREIMTAVVKHLHALVREVSLTPEEWFKAIRFLTEVGHTCTEWRQEFILLSDTLGVSMLVDSINQHRPEGSTENSVLGPFYLPGAPRYPMGTNICLDGLGEPVVVSGRVTDSRGEPVAGALLDVWQTNDNGFYDVQQKGIQPEWNLRGVFETGADGRYWFRSAKPRYYPIPDDGPVGGMLKAMGRHPYRPAHLHFIISAPGYDTVVTQIFAPDCPYLEEDAVFGVKQSLVGDFRHENDPKEAARLEVANPFWTVEWNVILAPTTAA